MANAIGFEDIEDVRRRFERLYSGAVADILDKNGFRNQVLPFGISPFTEQKRVAGLAFTGQGYPCNDALRNDTETRLRMLASIFPASVSVWACAGSTDCAHWGEMMSAAARQKGCAGAVIDGGVRDLDLVNAMKFPVFARFHCSASSVGRWEIREFQVPIKIGGVFINPGDFVFGDTDGVVIVPLHLTLDVLAAAEEIYYREQAMREELNQGVSIADAHRKYGSL